VAGSLRLVPGKSNAWELRVFVGRDSAGRVRHRHVRFHGTRRQAERELARLVAEQDATPQAAPEEPKVWGATTTVNDAIAAWRENGWEDLSPKTTLRYESVWANHINSSIGRHRIATLGTYEVERYFRELKNKQLSEGSVRMIRAVLHRACKLARRWSGNTLPNPFSDAELPTWKLAERRDAVRAPSAEEVRVLIAAAEGEDLRVGVFIRLLAATGLRRGEACAVRWADLDVDAATLRVDEAVVAARGGAVVRGPKTRASVRTVALDASTLARFALLRDEQERLAVQSGSHLGSQAFVFSFEPGGAVPPYPDSFSHALSRLRKRHDLPADVHLHSLRHFHATVLDPVISEAQKQTRLGWSTVQMARHYTDGVAEEDRRAAEHITHVLG
jgi:integrase